MTVFHDLAGQVLGETAALFEKTGVFDLDQEAFQHLVFVQQGDIVERLKLVEQNAGLAVLIEQVETMTTDAWCTYDKFSKVTDK